MKGAHNKRPHTVSFHFYEMAKINKSTETESRLAKA